MRLKVEEQPIVNRIAGEFCAIAGIKDPIVRADLFVALCILLNKKKLTTKNITEFMKSLKLPNPVRLNAGIAVRKFKYQLLENINNKEICTCPFEAHEKVISFRPFVSDNSHLARAIWLWVNWKRHNYRGESTFATSFYEYSVNRIEALT